MIAPASTDTIWPAWIVRWPGMPWTISLSIEMQTLAGIAAAVPGNHIDDISAAVEAVAAGAGLGVIRQFVGHGIGRRMHEDPAVPNDARPGRGLALRPGLVLALEPMLCAGGHDDYRTAADGPRLLTVLP